MNDLLDLVFDLFCMPFPACGCDDDDDDEYDDCDCDCDDDDGEYCFSHGSGAVPHSSKYRD